MMTGNIVAPFVGAWIEINWVSGYGRCNQVAPFVGAWIEIQEMETHTRR